MLGHARYILTFSVILTFGVYFFLNLDKFESLLNVNPYFLGLILVGNIVLIASNGLFTQIILKPLGKFIPLVDSIYVSLISSVGNFFAPAGAGLGIRAVYLKKKHGLPYGDYMTMLYGNYVIVFLVSSFFALLSLYLLRDNQSEPYFVLLAIFAGIFAVSLLLCLIRVPQVPSERFMKIKYLNTLAKVMLRMIEGWNGIVTDRRLMVKLALLTTANLLVTVVMSKLIISSLHLDISFPALLLFSLLGSLSLFVNITPANLGVKEAIYLFSGQVIGFSTNEILAIALIDRGVLFVTLASLWLYSAKFKLSKKLG